MTARAGRDPVGSATEEAALLLATLADRAREHLDNGAGPGDEAAEHPVECGWCPLCRGLRLLRQTSPEARAEVVEKAMALGLALSRLAEQVAEQVGGQVGGQPDGQPDEQPDRREDRWA